MQWHWGHENRHTHTHTQTHTLLGGNNPWEFHKACTDLPSEACPQGFRLQSPDWLCVHLEGVLALLSWHLVHTRLSNQHTHDFLYANTTENHTKQMPILFPGWNVDTYKWSLTHIDTHTNNNCPVTVLSPTHTQTHTHPTSLPPPWAARVIHTWK